jgi:hypothetical protein
MAQCLIHSFFWPPPQVFEAALLAAPHAGFGISQSDPAGMHLYLDKPRLVARYPCRFDLSVTDSGLGDTVVSISWDPRRQPPWPVGSGNRTAKRLCRRIGQTLRAGQFPTTPG